jgi:CheY-like chemotaxis protein
LAICRSLAEAMGGRLTASSPGPGLGSTFRLELDTVPAPATAPAPAARGTPPSDRSGPPHEPGLRVLLVEDNQDTLRFLATVLRGRGHDVVTADTIAAARQAVGRSERPFELLVSDIELPDGNGLELMRELGARGGIRGIAMSGYGAEEDLELSRAAGFLKHLIKPIDPSRLDAAIRRACDAAPSAEADDEDESWSPTRGGDSGPFRVISTHEP